MIWKRAAAAAAAAAGEVVVVVVMMVVYFKEIFWIFPEETREKPSPL